MRPPRTFTFAAIAELAFAAGLLAWALKANSVAIPGGVVRLTGMALLTAFALRGHHWARWTFCSLEVFTGILGLVFTFVSFESGSARFEFTVAPLLVALFVLFL